MTPTSGTTPGTTTIPAIHGSPSPAAVAESITGRPYLSWSQVSGFRGCPRAFAYRYVERAEPAFVSSNLLFGGAIHAALQAHFEARMAGADLSLDELADAYRDAWAGRLEEQGDLPVRYGEGEDAETLAASARGLLEAFLGSDLASPESPIIGVEETLSGALADDLPDLLAVVDLIHGDGEGLRVLDFKTSRSKWGEARVAEAAEQLRLYQVMSRHLTGDGAAIRLAFGVLVKTKTPSVQVLDVPETAADAGQLAETIRPVWRAMQLGVDYANPSMTGCGGCPFRDRCPAHRG
mgnify:CR=1 FL=1